MRRSTIAALALTAMTACSSKQEDPSAASDSGTTTTKVGAASLRTIALGGRHTCVVESDRTVVCAGDNSYSQLGDGTHVTPSKPIRVPGLGDVVDLALGPRTTCARKADDSVWCWGKNDLGEIEVGGEPEISTPKRIAALEGSAQIAFGTTHGCARRYDGTVSCWGTGTFGALGDGAENGSHPPKPVVGLADVVEISVGGAASCARHLDGTVSCWGANGFGTTGTGSNEQSTPRATKVTGLTDIVEIAVAREHACARTKAGDLLCWGKTIHGQTAGIVNTKDTCFEGATSSAGCLRTPQAVAGVANVEQVAVNDSYTCVRIAGVVKCFGADSHLKIGVPPPGTCVGPTDTAPCVIVPTDVPGVTGAVDIALGENHAAARTDAGIFLWGNDDVGQLGDGPRSTDQAPKRVDW